MRQADDTHRLLSVTAGTWRDENSPESQLVVKLAAVVLILAIAVRYRLSPGVPVGYLAAAAMLPVTIQTLRSHRGMRLTVALSLLAGLSGVVLTWLWTSHGQVSSSLLIVHSTRILGLGVAALGLLWARSVLGTRRLVLVFAIGTFGSLLLTGVNTSNVWKFSLSVPVILLVLSLPWIYRRRPAEVVALLALAAVSATNNSRSAAAMLLIAAGLVLTQARGRSTASRTSAVSLVLLRVGLFGLGGYYVVRAAALEGILGIETQQRTAAQLEATGSVLLGGRPEVGASLALISDRWIGYGSGAVPGPSQVQQARDGMKSLGQSPDVGYVQNFMFGGNGFQLHSMVGDLWVYAGPAGFALAVALVAYAVIGASRRLSTGVAPAVTLFLAMRLAWDFAFSPFASAMLTLPLAAAVLVPRNALTQVGRPRRTETSRW